MTPNERRLLSTRQRMSRACGTAAEATHSFAMRPSRPPRRVAHGRPLTRMTHGRGTPRASVMDSKMRELLVLLVQHAGPGQSPLASWELSAAIEASSTNRLVRGTIGRLLQDPLPAHRSLSSFHMALVTDGAGADDSTRAKRETRCHNDLANGHKMMATKTNKPTNIDAHTQTNKQANKRANKQRSKQIKKQ